MSRKFVIYALSDPRTDEIRYVGKSSSGLMRPNQRHSAYCESWRKSLKSIGLRPIVEILEEFEVLDVKQLNDAEIFWIASFRLAGFRLTNLTDGGDGVTNPSIESREKNRKAHLGKKLSEDHKRNISLGGRGTKRPPKTEEQLERMAAAQRGKKHSLQTKMKMSASRLDRKRGPYKKRDVTCQESL